MICWYIESMDIVMLCPRSLRKRRSSRKHLLDLADTGDERVDLVLGGVDAERRASGSRDAITDAHRTCAVVPGPHGDAVLIQQLGDVMRVDALEGERDRRPAVDRGLGPDERAVREWSAAARARRR